MACALPEIDAEDPAVGSLVPSLYSTQTPHLGCLYRPVCIPSFLLSISISEAKRTNKPSVT